MSLVVFILLTVTQEKRVDGDSKYGRESIHDYVADDEDDGQCGGLHEDRMEQKLRKPREKSTAHEDRPILNPDWNPLQRTDGQLSHPQKEDVDGLERGDDGEVFGEKPEALHTCLEEVVSPIDHQNVGVLADVFHPALAATKETVETSVHNTPVLMLLESLLYVPTHQLAPLQRQQQHTQALDNRDHTAPKRHGAQMEEENGSERLPERVSFLL